MRRGGDGFTLIEVLIVMAIIAILVAILVPNYQMAMNRARQKRAMAEMHGLATAITSYTTDTGMVPPAGATWTNSDSAIPVSAIVPYYIIKLPNPDPWSHKYQYSTSTDNQYFGIRCLGLEGIPDSPDLSALLTSEPVRTVCFENNIVWVNSGFAWWPEGIQTQCY